MIFNSNNSEKLGGNLGKVEGQYYPSTSVLNGVGHFELVQNEPILVAPTANALFAPQKVKRSNVVYLGKLKC